MKPMTAREKVQTFNRGRLCVKETSETYTSSKLTSSRDSAEVCRGLYDESISLMEEFHILCLSRNNRVLKTFRISSGGVSGTVVDPKIVFASALSVGASAIILCHNHPSGELRPSDSDINLTRKLARGGDLLDIKVLDHIILSG